MEKPLGAFLTIKVNSRLEKAIWLADSISRDMARLAKGLKEEGLDYSFNALGELQGRGSELDRLLGELGLLEKIIYKIHSC